MNRDGCPGQGVPGAAAGFRLWGLRPRANVVDESLVRAVPVRVALLPMEIKDRVLAVAEVG